MINAVLQIQISIRTDTLALQKIVLEKSKEVPNIGHVH